MNNPLQIIVEQELNKAQLESFLRDNYDCGEFIWVEGNYYTYSIDNELYDCKTYISVEIDSAGFKYDYTVYLKDNLLLELKAQIEVLKKLAWIMQIEILSSDDEINPWSWVLIEPNGQTSTIFVQDDELVFSEYYNFPFGDFRTKYKLSNLQIEQLKKIIASVFIEIEIQYSTDGPIFGGEFNKVKDGHPKLKDFDHHYQVRPVGKNVWFDREEKSRLFTSMMMEFRDLMNDDLCIFPRIFCEEMSIEGGTQYEDHCILLTSSGQEKIVYKQRRSKWKWTSWFRDSEI